MIISNTSELGVFQLIKRRPYLICLLILNLRLAWIIFECLNFSFKICLSPGVQSQDCAENPTFCGCVFVRSVAFIVFFYLK